MVPSYFYVILYLEIILMGSLLVLFIRFKTLGISQMVSQRNFTYAIDAELMFFLSDLFVVLISYDFLPLGKYGLMLAKTLYFFSTALMCFYWFIYFEHLQGSAFVKKRFLISLSSCLVWVLAILLISNFSTGKLFYVEDGVYHRGPWFNAQYALAYFYVLIAFGHAFINTMMKLKVYRPRLMVLLAIFPVAPAVAGILQHEHPELPVACPVLSLVTLVFYQLWLDDLISLDPLTKLNNRKQLFFHYEQWQHHEENTQMYLVLIDANKFKSINDTYGHIEGDAALLRIADALRISCKCLHYRPNIARYGGDEFVMLVRTRDVREIDNLMEYINNCLAEMNAKAGAPYELSVSIGFTRADKQECLKEVIERADEKLYEEKQRRRARG